MTDKLNIYQKLVEVRKGIAKFHKDTVGYNFKYVSGTQVLSAIKKDIDKLGIILEQHLTAPVVEAGIVKSPMKMIWVNADDPQDRIEIDWFMVGRQKDPSQGFGSGLTYSERYFMLKFFSIPTDDDDPDRNKGGAKPTSKTDPKKKDKTLTENQIKKLFVNYHKGDKEAAKEDYELYKDMDKATQKDTIENMTQEVK